MCTMENVHKINNRPWISEVVSVRQFVKDWTEASEDVFKFMYSAEDSGWKEQFVSEMDITDKDVFTNLEHECRPAALTCEGEEQIDYVPTAFVIPPGLELETVKAQHQDIVKRTAIKPYKMLVQKNLRYHNHAVNKAKKQLAPSNQPVYKEAELPEAVLTVQVYRPKQQPPPESKEKRRKTSLNIEDEISVLGSQKLTALVERISCVSDLCVPGDFSDNPDMTHALRACEVYSSRFLYINGTFYNDMSKPENRDYSKVIREWAETKSRGIGPFQTAVMEETTFLDLELRLGYPYVYQHQGNCEHLIVFTDLRILHPDDDRNVNNYPVFESVFPRPRTVCMVCHAETARWVTHDNDRLPQNPYFFCESCFLSFNYTVDKKKIGHFRAQPYFDRTAML